jgi:hypothetical protein
MSNGNNAAVAFTNSIDGTIIKGFLENRRKKCSVGNHNVAMRDCLGCNARFLSMGVGNRLCPRCRNRR